MVSSVYMHEKITKDISLTPHFDRFIEHKLRSGRYRSASEVVREGLRLMEERERALTDIRNQIEVGWQQAEAGDMVDGPGVFEEIRQLSKSRRRRRSSSSSSSRRRPQPPTRR
jgi:antitoxin ParD1/3/4